MDQLYLWVKDPPPQEIIQQELLAAICHDYRIKTHAFTYIQSYIARKCPVFWQWLAPRLRTETRLMRFYVTEPYGRLPPHIDGAPVTVPFGLNFPVLNCQGTTMTWYGVDSDDVQRWNQHNAHGYMSSYKLREDAESRSTILQQLEITRPCFVRNDIMHSVENPRDTWRIMLSIRFPLHAQRYRTIAEVIDCEVSDPGQGISRPC